MDAHEFSIKRDITESENKLEYKIELLRAETSKSIEFIRKDIEILRAETHKAIAETKTQLIIWMGGIAFTSVTLGVGFLTWFIENH